MFKLFSYKQLKMLETENKNRNRTNKSPLTNDFENSNRKSPIPTKGNKAVQLVDME